MVKAVINEGNCKNIKFMLEKKVNIPVEVYAIWNDVSNQHGRHSLVECYYDDVKRLSL